VQTEEIVTTLYADSSGIKTKQLAGVALNSKVSGLAISENKENDNHSRMITGVIKGQSGEPLPGVSVTIQGSSIGTITDTNGNFRLILAPGQKMLEVSYIGYNTQNVTLADKSNVEISLKESLVALNEVVVTAYGEKRKAKSAAGNISKSDSPSGKDKEVMSDKSENRSLQLNTIDSLKLLLNKDSGNKILIKKLAEKYLQAGTQEESLEQLKKLQSLTTDPSKLKELDEIIKNTESGNYKAALKKLKKV